MAAISTDLRRFRDSLAAGEKSFLIPSVEPRSGKSGISSEIGSFLLEDEALTLEDSLLDARTLEGGVGGRLLSLFTNSVAVGVDLDPEDISESESTWMETEGAALALPLRDFLVDDLVLGIGRWVLDSILFLLIRTPSDSDSVTNREL